MFFNNKKMTENNNSYMVKIAALLIHVAKIDEKYSDKEEEIIKKTLIDLEVNQNEIENLMSQAKIIEENANQILDFTKEVKNLEEENKIKIIKSLWKIVYSDKEADMYETNLMRRLAGLLYIDSKTMGDIKDQIKKENS